MMNNWKHHALSLFWPVGLERPVSEAAQDELRQCIDAWWRGDKREPKTFLAYAEFPGDSFTRFQVTELGYRESARE